MIRTDEQIQQDVYDAIKGTELQREVTGQLLKDLRPAGSDKEDIVVRVLSSTAGQRQTAYVNVNIYVADIFADGQYEKDRPRCRHLSEMAARLLETKKSGLFRWDMESMHTVPQPETNEHIVNIKLFYQHFNL